MKAILVIEMPKYCDECPCCTWIPEYSKYGCGISGDLEDITDKPSWCPLKPLPPHEKALMFGSEFEFFSEKVGEIVLDAIGETE